MVYYTYNIRPHIINSEDMKLYPLSFLLNLSE